MAHAHTCRACGAVLEVGEFECGLEVDHEHGLCDRCSEERDWVDAAVDIGGEG